MNEEKIEVIGRMNIGGVLIRIGHSEYGTRLMIEKSDMNKIITLQDNSESYLGLNPSDTP